MHRIEGGEMYRVELYARVRHACRIDGLSRREAAREFGIDHKTVAKMLAFSVPPGYRRSGPPRRPKLDGFTGIIDRILEEDGEAHRKQRHTGRSGSSSGCETSTDLAAAIRS